MRARRPLVLLLLALSAACADPFIESTTYLEGTPDTTGPYRVHSTVIGTHLTDSVELFYNPVDAEPSRYIPVIMEALDEDGRAGELFVGDIPGQPTGTSIRYFVAVQRDGERVAEDPVGGDLRPFVLTIAP